MFTRLRPGKPLPALVISCIALFVALSGSSYAVIVLPKGSVGTKQLRNNAVTSAKIGVDQVTGADVNEATLGQVPSAATAGSANTSDTAKSANSASNADLLDGIDSASFLQQGAPATGDLAGNYPGPSIAPDAITGSEVLDNSLSGGDLNESTLGIVPNANLLDGLDSNAFVRRRITFLGLPIAADSYAAESCKESSRSIGGEGLPAVGDLPFIVPRAGFPNGLVAYGLQIATTSTLILRICNITNASISAGAFQLYIGFRRQ